MPQQAAVHCHHSSSTESEKNTITHRPKSFMSRTNMQHLSRLIVTKHFLQLSLCSHSYMTQTPRQTNTGPLFTLQLSSFAQRSIISSWKPLSSCSSTKGFKFAVKRKEPWGPDACYSRIMIFTFTHFLSRIFHLFVLLPFLDGYIWRLSDIWTFTVYTMLGLSSFPQLKINELKCACFWITLRKMLILVEGRKVESRYGKC